MDITVDKLLKFPAEYLSEYFYILSQTALGRVPTYTSIPTNTSLGNETHRTDERLWMFLIVSIILGLLLQSVPVGSSNLPSIGVTILILTCWIAFSVISYGFCRLFGGRGQFLNSMSSMLQVLGAVYVVSSLGSLLLGGAFKVISEKESRYVYFFGLQFLLLLRYIPVAIGRGHDFTGARRVVVGGMLAIAFVGLNIVVLFYGLFAVTLKDIGPVGS